MKERSLESFGRNECVCLGERRWPVEGGGEGGNERKERRSFENERIDHDSFWRFVHFVHSLVNVTTLEVTQNGGFQSGQHHGQCQYPYLVRMSEYLKL